MNQREMGTVGYDRPQFGGMQAEEFLRVFLHMIKVGFFGKLGH